MPSLPGGLGPWYQGDLGCSTMRGWCWDVHAPHPAPGTIPEPSHLGSLHGQAGQAVPCPSSQHGLEPLHSSVCHILAASGDGVSLQGLGPTAVWGSWWHWGGRSRVWPHGAAQLGCCPADGQRGEDQGREQVCPCPCFLWLLQPHSLLHSGEGGCRVSWVPASSCVWEQAARELSQHRNASRAAAVKPSEQRDATCGGSGDVTVPWCRVQNS